MAFERLAGALNLEQNDDRAVQRRYVIFERLAPVSDAMPISLPATAN